MEKDAAVLVGRSVVSVCESLYTIGDSLSLASGIVRDLQLNLMNDNPELRESTDPRVKAYSFGGRNTSSLLREASDYIYEAIEPVEKASQWLQLGTPPELEALSPGADGRNAAFKEMRAQIRAAQTPEAKQEIYEQLLAVVSPAAMSAVAGQLKDVVAHIAAYSRQHPPDDAESSYSAEYNRLRSKPSRAAGEICRDGDYQAFPNLVKAARTVRLAIESDFTNPRYDPDYWGELDEGLIRSRRAEAIQIRKAMIDAREAATPHPQLSPQPPRNQRYPGAVGPTVGTPRFGLPGPPGKNPPRPGPFS